MRPGRARPVDIGYLSGNSGTLKNQNIYYLARHNNANYGPNLQYLDFITE
jgi:hypothetical protein